MKFSNIFVLALVSMLVLNVGGVMAVHDANVAIDPNVANCETLPSTFTVTIENDIGSLHKIFELRIYKGTAGIVDGTFSCGPAPAGWTFEGYNPTWQYCQYDANTEGYKIAPGQSKNFTFDAQMEAPISQVCKSSFKVSTLDDQEPEGEHEYNWPEVHIDCTPPEITKTITSGTYQGVCPPSTQTPGDVCWMTHGTIHVSVTDDTCTDPCNLGMGYCEWSYTVDGTLEDEGFVENGDSIEWDITFDEDSLHELTITCVDIAGNVNEDVEVFRVDDTPPVTEKLISEPKKLVPIPGSDLFVEYVDTYTKITLDADDPEYTPKFQGDCSIGVDKTWYYNEWILEEPTGGLGYEYCYQPDVYCNEEYLGQVPDPYELNSECIELGQLECEYLGHGTPEWHACMDKWLNEICGIHDWKLYDGSPITKPDESCHILYYFSIDHLGNKEEMQYNCFFVDKTPPEVDKIVGMPKVEELDLEQLGNGKAAWVQSQSYSGTTSAKLVIPESSTGTDFAGVDSFFDVFVELDDVTSLSYYRKVVQYDNGWSPIVILGIDADGDGIFEAQPLEWESGSIPRNPALLGDDSFIQCEATTGLSGLDASFVHVDAYNNFKCYTPTADGTAWVGYESLSYYQANPVGKIEPTDKIAMVKVKLGGNPSTQDNEIAYVDYVELNGVVVIDEIDGFTWVTPQTDITFLCEDQGPHPSEDEELCFKVSYDLAVGGYMTDEYCEKYAGEGAYLDGDWCCVATPNRFIFNFNTQEDSWHDLEYYCEDAVEKKSDVYVQHYKVDSTPPIIDRTLDGPKEGMCPPVNEGDVCYIQDATDGIASGTSILIHAHDEGTCAVDQVECEWHYWLDGEHHGSGFDCNGPDCDIKFYEDTVHDLKVICKDVLGNEAVLEETYYLDSQGPEVTKTFDGPRKIEPIPGSDYSVEWIDGVTKIELTATDLPDAPCAVGFDKIYYVITPMDDDACWDPEEFCYYGQYEPGAFTEYTGPVGGIEESCHKIEFYAEDKLGNIGPMGKNCFFVDKTSPSMWKELGDENVECEEGEDCDFYINQDTPITFHCEDQGDHPSNDVTMYINVYWKETFEDEWSEEPIHSFVKNQEEWTFNCHMDSIHKFEYWCEDAVEKASDLQTEIDVVDTVAPEITKIVSEPKEGQCPPENDGDVCFVDGVTEIDVTTIDPEPHPVGGVECYWWYYVYNDMYPEGLRFPSSGTYSTFPINFPEESEHELHIKCKDLLGNEIEDVETFYVDKTPPEIWKYYGEPFKSYQFNDYWAKWMSVETPIFAGVTDTGPHMSGIAEVKYRVTLVDDEDCKYYYDAERTETYDCDEVSGDGWTFVDEEDYDEFVFGIEQESCHMIEIMATDNVDKCSLHRQWVYVDDTGPNPLKTVGEPKEIWTPGHNEVAPSQFYEGIEDYCMLVEGEPDSCAAGENCIECWKVTTLTPIVMDCEDPVPHPVDHEKICFNVNFDGGEYTQYYCEGDPVYDPETGLDMCCYEYEEYESQGGVWIYFSEESEHELEYFCEDALGNRGPLDIEKFKVEGTAFELPIFKKWNLVSVPFELLNETPEDVFESVEEEVEIVWSYDPATKEWYSYTPDGEDDDDLKAIEPGWGYWVLAKDNGLIKIAGSLFKMGPNYLPERPLYDGWNLIGYYGTDWQDYDFSVDPCVYGRGLPFYNNVYNSLYSLMDVVTVTDPETTEQTETAQPNWRSLWTFQTCGVDSPPSPYWLPLDYGDYMYPGYGYWVHMNEDDKYAPSFKFLDRCGDGVKQTNEECDWKDWGSVPPGHICNFQCELVEWKPCC